MVEFHNFNFKLAQKKKNMYTNSYYENANTGHQREKLVELFTSWRSESD
jgi:hypothetical protein